MHYPEEAKPVNAAQHLSKALRSRLCQWIPDVFEGAGFYPDAGKFAQPKATAIVGLLDDALTRLEGKTGERAEAAREFIRAARVPIAEGLDLVNSLQGDFGGPLGLKLQKRIISTRAALASALDAKELATRSQVRDALLAVEEAWADIRELDRDLASIHDKLLVPWKRSDAIWPDIAELRSAEQTTAALESLSSKKATAAQVHAAIEQGMKASPLAKVLFIAFESKPDHVLIEWRARAAAGL